MFISETDASPSSLVLLNMCNHVTSDGDGPEIKAIHEYLEARKFLLASLRVSLILSQCLVAVD